MPTPEDRSWDDIKRTVAKNLARKLCGTFNAVAKIAIQASAEFSESADDPDVISKVEKAHSTVTLIIDDAMRGLGEATRYVAVHTAARAFEADEDEEDEDGEDSSPH